MVKREGGGRQSVRWGAHELRVGVLGGWRERVLMKYSHVFAPSFSSVQVDFNKCTVELNFKRFEQVAGLVVIPTRL